jgi:hypothetical protein
MFTFFNLLFINKKISSIRRDPKNHSLSYLAKLIAGIGTTLLKAGCRVSQGPFPPPLWIRTNIKFYFSDYIIFNFNSQH